MTIAKNIDELALLENYLLALNFPGNGIVPFRVLTREQTVWDPYVVNYSSTTTPFPADTWKDSARLGHPTDNSVSNIFEVTNKLHIYQLFYGIKHSDTRAYPTYPEGVTRRNLDAKNMSAKSDFGYIDGSMSPYNDPKPVSEIWIPEAINIGFAWYNAAPVAQTIVTKWIVNMYGVKLIKDVDLVEKILNRKVECRIATLGGLQSFIYDTNAVWGVSPIPIDANRAEIASAMEGR